LPYFAAVLARRPSGWSADEIDLKDVEDLDGVIEEIRAVGDDEADLQLLFVEEDDEWFAVVRVDEDGDPRVFLSDGRAMETSQLGALFGEAADVVGPSDDADLDGEDEGEEDEDDEDEAVSTTGEPVGDSELLSDLGTSSSQLLKLCAEEGQLPADIISVICESAGCAEVLDALRVG
jgi:putative tRNA adenosine deaminase-associated protein